jgi:hypothetical protein
MAIPTLKWSAIMFTGMDWDFWGIAFPLYAKITLYVLQ